MRAFQGVIQQLQTLKISVSWSQILHAWVNKDTLNKARTLELLPLPQESVPATPKLSTLVKNLRISVSTKGQNSVDLTLGMVLELESLMPKDVLEKLQNSKTIDINLTQKKIKESGIARQNVFSFADNDKEYSVWLE